MSLATSAQLKAHLGITASTHDTILAQILAEVDAMIKKICGRNIEEETYTDQILDGDDQFPLIQLSDKPIKANTLTSFTYNSGTTATPVWTTVPRDDYEIYYDEGTIYLYSSYPGKRNLRLTYQAGEATVPKDLELACIKLSAGMFEKRKSEGAVSESLDGVSINWGEIMTPEITAILNNHKRITIV